MDSNSTSTINGATITTSTDEGKWSMSVEIPADAPFIPATRTVAEFLRYQADVMATVLKLMAPSEDGGNDG